MSGHHKKAISDGLRHGSSEAGKVMAKWRWQETAGVVGVTAVGTGAAASSGVTITGITAAATAAAPVVGVVAGVVGIAALGYYGYKWLTGGK